MTPAAIAAICGLFYSPPASYDAIPLPPTALVIHIPFSQIDAKCGTRSGVSTVRMTPRGPATSTGRIEYGCADTVHMIAYVPTWETWPGTRACYDEVVLRHEPAHLKGWTHP